MLPYGYNTGYGDTGAVAATGGHPYRAYPSRLSINPSRLVAPVGQPVVLLAGICDDEGYYIRKQAIEWSISPDSVGTIVEVDRLDQSALNYFFHNAPIKRNGMYAIGRTSNTSQVLPRGTPDPSDDIPVQRGQTWISINSASEGSTHVTAVAPTVEGWSERQQTATIHWVDGRWQFPAPAVSSYGGGQTLVTRVNRTTDNAPVEGWLVRYEIAGGTPAAFDMNGAQTTEVPTNSVGEAAVTVIPQGDFAGTTQIGMQVIRRGRTPGDLPRLAVGQGSTTVTWAGGGEGSTIPATPSIPDIPAPTTTRPSLAIRVSGASVAEIGANVVYQFRVENLGNQTAENVELSSTVPAELTYDRSSPQASLFGDALRWELGPLPPGMVRAVTVYYEVGRANAIRVCATASAAGAESASDCVTTDVRSNEASIALVIQGDSTGRVGDQISYDLYVTNQSDQPISSVELTADFDDGLNHVSDAQGDRHIFWNIGALGPRDTRTLPLNFTVRSAGRRCFTVQVAAAGGASDREEVCIEVAPDQGYQAAPRGLSPPTDVAPLNPNLGPNPSSSAPPIQPPTGPESDDLSLRIRSVGVDPANPQVIVYAVEVTNNGLANDYGVVLETLIPDGTRLVSQILPPNVSEVAVSTNGKKHDYSPIATLRPGEMVTYQFFVTQSAAGTSEFLARVRSQRYPTPITASNNDL